MKAIPEGSDRSRDRQGRKPPRCRAVRLAGRLIILLSPLPILLLFEVILRLAGSGYDPGFLVRSPAGKRDTLMTNPHFGRRFFARHMAREPEVRAIRMPKPVGTCRIAVVGGSAAMGDPDASYGLARMLELLLSDELPGRDVEVINAAMTAINSHVVLPIVRDCLRADLDALVVYMGNNEVIGPFGTASRESTFPPLWLLKSGAWLRQFRVGQGLAALASMSRTRASDPTALGWRGMEHFLDHEVPYGDPRLENTYTGFRQNLTEILELAADAGVPVALCTVPVNRRSCAPFSGKPEPTRKLWGKAVSEGGAAEANGGNAEAAERYQEAVDLDQGAADGWFLLARALDATGKNDAAMDCYLYAQEQDRLRFRADARINAVIQVCAADHVADGERVTFVDAEKTIQEHERAGKAVFLDHVHLTFAGTQAMAEGVCSAIHRGLRTAQLPTPGKTSQQPKLTDRLAFTEWDRLRIERGMLDRRTRPPFTLQLDWQDTTARRGRLDTLLANAQELATAAAAYETAIRMAPQDSVLRRNAARVLLAAGRWEDTCDQWRKVAEMQPFSPEPFQNLGNLFSDANRLAEAEHMYRQALEVRPDCAGAYNGLGQLGLRNGRVDAAKLLLKQAVACNPSLPEPHNNLANVHIANGDVNEAFAEWGIALAIRPGYTAARLNLARALWGQGHTSRALEQVAEALRHRPGFPDAQRLQNE
ncbi:MAG: tetratricopeptide repeat protein, partial [Lentisphaerae bacterium]|nr:tetratricopeptide repeat protein [Lentisphaerota bacterium]